MLTMFDPGVLLALKVALGAILFDTVIGWILAAVKDEFDIRKVPQFLKTNVFPYIGALVVLALATTMDTAYEAVFYFVTVLVAGKFGVEALKDKLAAFFAPVGE